MSWKSCVRLVRPAGTDRRAMQSILTWSLSGSPAMRVGVGWGWGTFDLVQPTRSANTPLFLLHSTERPSVSKGSGGDFGLGLGM